MGICCNENVVEKIGNTLTRFHQCNKENDMYIVNDICYAGEFQEDIKVTEVKPLVGGVLLVTFSTGEKRLFDTTKLKGTAFLPLSDEKIFNQPTLFHGVITWNSGEIDIAPETVYRESYAYSE